MLVAWTTTAERTDAERLARGAVEAHLAVCAQVDGPVTSYYRWEGKLEKSTEHRVWFKCLRTNGGALGAWVHHHHPYDTPQWVVVDAEHVGEKYLSWAIANSTSAPFNDPKPS